MKQGSNRFRNGALVLALTSAMFGMAPYSAPVSAKAAVENKQVAEALTEAKRLAAKKQWDAALVAVRKAKGVEERSAYASYKIDQFEAYVLTQQRDYAKAAAAFERLATSATTPTKDRAANWKTAAQLHLQANSYDKASHAAEQALKSDANDPQLVELLAQSQYLGKDYRAASETLTELVEETEKRGKKPQEEWLQMMLASADQLKDQQRIDEAWESVLRHYPKDNYWETVLRTKLSRADSDAIEAGYRQLMFDVGVLKRPHDYEELALAAIDAGAPGEAVRVIQAGLENGNLGGQHEARYRRMLGFAQKKVQEREQNLSQLTAQSATLPAESSIALGRLHLGQGHYDQAIAALERGLADPKVDGADRARLTLGIAYLKNDQPKRAREAFGSVAAKSEWRDLADLWRLRAANN